jgi:hypothetical protein
MRAVPVTVPVDGLVAPVVGGRRRRCPGLSPALGPAGSLGSCNPAGCHRGWGAPGPRGRLPSPQPALVAQLERASDYGSEGWGFESLRARRVSPSHSPRDGLVFRRRPPLLPDLLPDRPSSAGRRRQPPRLACRVGRGSETGPGTGDRGQPRRSGQVNVMGGAFALVRAAMRDRDPAMGR